MEVSNTGATGSAAADGVVRRLVGRLCLAGLGRSPELDIHLKGIGQMARTELDIAQIQSMLEPLTHAVTALDSPAPAPMSAVPPTEHNELRNQREQLQRERAEIEQLLLQFDSHLETLSSFFVHQEEQRTSSNTDTERLTTLVQQEIQEISTDISHDRPLLELRRRIGTRLHAIGSHVDHFRVCEQRRQGQQQDHIRVLKGRVNELEREKRSLRHRLSKEHRQAMTDPLTGIPNRMAWDERIAREFSRWQREGGVFSLLVWDVDHFKAINDQYGHRAGDKMLMVLGQHMSRELRSTDFIARYGGEEFAMLLVHQPADAALKIANRIRTRVPEISTGGVRVPVTLSCGVTTFRMGDTPDSAFERADQALYAAKGGGRNRCVMR